MRMREKERTPSLCGESKIPVCTRVLDGPDGAWVSGEESAGKS